VDEGDLLLKGRGYGHRVGLCQEGAMKMSEKGYNFREIIQFYYSGVMIVNYNKLMSFDETALKIPTF